MRQTKKLKNRTVTAKRIIEKAKIMFMKNKVPKRLEPYISYYTSFPPIYEMEVIDALYEYFKFRGYKII